MDYSEVCGAGWLRGAASTAYPAKGKPRPKVLQKRPALALWVWLLVAGLLMGTGACSSPSSASGRGLETPLVTSTQLQTVQAQTVTPPPTLTHTPVPTTTQSPPPSPSFTPAASRTPTPPGCLAAGGRIEPGQLYTEISPYPWEFRVYVPPCYDQEIARRYPVLVLIHGSTYNDDQWDRMGVDELADRLIASGEMAPFLIFMPRDRVWVEPAEDPFGEALVDYLLPWLELNYRTQPGRENRAIGGLSRGASWAVHLGLSHWEIFGSIGGHSLPVFWSDTGKVRGWLAEIPPADLPRIYLDIGESDYLIKSALWFENVLNDMDIPHEWHLYPGRHEEAYWEAHLEGYLRWYAEAW